MFTFTYEIFFFFLNTLIYSTPEIYPDLFLGLIISVFFGARENVPLPTKRLGPGYPFLYKNT